MTRKFLLSIPCSKNKGRHYLMGYHLTEKIRSEFSFKDAGCTLQERLTWNINCQVLISITNKQLWMSRAPHLKTIKIAL